MYYLKVITSESSLCFHFHCIWFQIGSKIKCNIQHKARHIKNNRRSDASKFSNKFKFILLPKIGIKSNYADITVKIKLYIIIVVNLDSLILIFFFLRSLNWKRKVKFELRLRDGINIIKISQKLNIKYQQFW